MRLRADVRAITGRVTHLQGERLTGEISQIPVELPLTLEVIEQDGGVDLLRLDRAGVCVADSWHESIDEAKAQASFEFGVVEADWREVDEPPP